MLTTLATQLYALYKQGINDPTFEKSPKPGIMDMVVSAEHTTDGACT